MRIIAGICKGRKLKTPGNDDIRPTADRVKEAVFSMLAPFISEETIVADLFCGTGNMGLEALSRGAGRAYFSDISKESLALAAENIKACGMGEKSILLKGDYRQNLHRIREMPDILFLDPPYEENSLSQALSILSEWDQLKSGALIVCEHRTRQVLPQEAGLLCQWKSRRYGATSITVYRLCERG